MTRKVIQDAVKTILVVLVVGVFAVACTEAGAGGGDNDDNDTTQNGSNDGGNDDGSGATADDPSEVDFSEPSTVITNAQSGLQNSDVEDPEASAALSWLFFFTSFYEGFADLVNEWDGQTGTWTESGVTYTVEATDTSWSWQFTTTEDGETVTVRYAVEQTSTGWDVEYTFNDQPLFAGTVSTDGLTGTYRYYDETGNPVLIVEWQEAESPYYLTYTASSYSDPDGDGTYNNDAVYTVSSTQDGTCGAWSYTESASEASGTWGTCQSDADFFGEEI